MATDYGKFLETENEKRRQREDEAQATREREARKAQDILDAIAAPLDAAFKPAVEEAKKQLAPHGVSINSDPDLSHRHRDGFKVHRYFRLYKKNSHGGTTPTSLHGFRVRQSDGIEAVFWPDDYSSNSPAQRISLIPTADFKTENVEDVIKHALAELVRIVD